MDDFDLYNEMFGEWIDECDEWASLQASILNDNTGTRINQQIVNNIYNIRRHLEFGLNYSDEMSVDEENETEINLSDNIFIDNLFTILNETNFNQEFEDVKVTLTLDQFSCLRNTIVTNIEASVEGETYLNKQCNICMDNYNLNENITFTVCDHFFHTDCIKNWLCNEKVTCPVCRKDNRLLN